MDWCYFSIFIRSYYYLQGKLLKKRYSKKFYSTQKLNFIKEDPAKYLKFYFIKIASFLFFDINSNPIAPITGYLNPNQIEIYLNLFSNDAYTEIKSQEDFKKFVENFESQFKI